MAEPDVEIIIGRKVLEVAFHHRERKRRFQGGFFPENHFVERLEQLAERFRGHDFGWHEVVELSVAIVRRPADTLQPLSRREFAESREMEVDGCGYGQQHDDKDEDG